MHQTTLHYWQSQRLSFTEFETDEGTLVKELFEQNVALQEVDPTFKTWSVSVYEDMIQRSHASLTINRQHEITSCFYLKKISLTEDMSTPIGYIQIETHTLKQNQFWLPMLTLSPNHQGRGYGKEIVESVVKQVKQSFDVKEVGLNVYAENVTAFRFWYECGFNQIRQFKPEAESGRKYHCVSLFRELG